MTRALLLLVLGLCTTAAHAAGIDERACMANAKTDLEKLYCRIVSEGQGAGLPSPTDFKRNDPQVQALLLRRPAGRLGLEVPEPGATAVETELAGTEPEAEPTAPFDDLPQTRQLADCSLQGRRIACPGKQYNLAENLPNSKLAEGVLEADNRFGLSSFEGDRNNEQAVRSYLSDAYDRYIPAMMEIGLGGNTMSFTAFYQAFHTTEEAGVDFARRMEETYSLLQQDKKTLAVKARYHEELPDDLSLCTVINPDIIVCDNVGTNWVYVSHSP